eukprot:303765-Hanusia_phi.AAC.1
MIRLEQCQWQSRSQPRSLLSGCPRFDSSRDREARWLSKCSGCPTEYHPNLPTVPLSGPCRSARAAPAPLP